MRIREAIGWLVFATHDVSESPTRFGCTPALFERIVDYAEKSGAHVLPVRDVAERSNPHVGLVNAFSCEVLDSLQHLHSIFT